MAIIGGLTEAIALPERCMVCGQEWALSYLYVELLEIAEDDYVTRQRRVAGEPCTHEEREQYDQGL